MARRRVASFLCFVIAGSIAVTARGADALLPAPRLDAARSKARELEKLRLIAKLHADAPKLVESRGGANPLAAPIFHRYDRP